MKAHSLHERQHSYACTTCSKIMQTTNARSVCSTMLGTITMASAFLYFTTGTLQTSMLNSLCDDIGQSKKARQRPTRIPTPPVRPRGAPGSAMEPCIIEIDRIVIRDVELQFEVNRCRNEEVKFQDCNSGQDGRTAEITT
ncbi:hypothetical protein DPMN_168771 [Dreissena polymorpha]|uniref:Uncharacterized protein n=1 Tax=Dreissena polymorpha TaxID=45954 RepID=A0A9D4IZY3_DREPO|nr:hypothetical protein DPMN_168771 [Dreissena polymorpha]